MGYFNYILVISVGCLLYACCMHDTQSSRNAFNPKKLLPFSVKLVFPFRIFLVRFGVAYIIYVHICTWRNSLVTQLHKLHQDLRCRAKAYIYLCHKVLKVTMHECLNRHYARNKFCLIVRVTNSFVLFDPVLPKCELTPKNELVWTKSSLNYTNWWVKQHYAVMTEWLHVTEVPCTLSSLT